ncbi:SRPBCC domain-containing protein [Streptomyces formicae]|uniref:SRPBCC family protein n=1 Tax=Streptomyces formicae TaxID=1616117 RepID=A0ABY3WCS3_9ACTN|nr:SRPBCC domain-containing protein [Streptomyces formicae]UNM10339.1 SRPBCC family protein [Streptomyces formicae]
MEHEVFVPVPAETLRQALSDPARVARCLPGLQQDADAAAGPLAGRLRIRVGGHTITYRGALRVTPKDSDFAVEGEGTEARGTGSAKVALTLRLLPAEGGTTLGFSGTSHADGRLAELPADTILQAAIRLLDRFAASLASEAPEPSASTEPDTTTDVPRTDDIAETESETEAEAETDTDTDADAGTGTGTGTDPASLFDVDVPPSALDPLTEDAFGDGDEPPAEAAHARRTMIGRSAEEVDHAPPRGRYAPVPAPQAGAVGGTLRWIAPAAALAIASAVVVGRALRRRR